MHIHKYEKWWLTFGISSLVLFLVIVGFSAFHYGSHPQLEKFTSILSELMR